MIDVAKHDIYDLCDVIAFEDKDILPGIQVQGRILSMWKEKETDEKCNFTVSILRRPFSSDPQDKPGDYISNTHLIYEYWDTNEYVTVKEQDIKKVIPSVTIDRKDARVDYFIDNFEKEELKLGVIHVSSYHDNDEGAAFNAIEPELILSYYHFDYQAEDYGTQLDWGSNFLLKLKKVIFDPFVSSLSKENANLNFALWRFMIHERNSLTPILDKVSGRQKEIIKRNRMYRPSISLPLIADLIQRFFALQDKSIAIVIEMFEHWEEHDLKTTLNLISKLEQSTTPDPLYIEEVELVDAVSLSSFIEKDEDSNSDTYSSASSPIPGKALFEEGEMSTEEEEEEEEEETTEDEYTDSDESSSIASYVRAAREWQREDPKRRKIVPDE